MSRDIIGDALNQVMNAKRAGKKKVVVLKSSKVLLNVLAIGKLRGYIRDYKLKDSGLEIEIGDSFNACLAIKPRYMIKTREIEKYVRRFLPAKNMGILVISTSKGLVTHQTAIEQGRGGSLIAYFY